MPSNLTAWTNENEGAKRIKVKLMLSETTQVLILDQEIDFKFNWRIKNVQSSQERRSLKDFGYVSVDKFELQIDFSDPLIVSRGV